MSEELLHEKEYCIGSYSSGKNSSSLERIDFDEFFRTAINLDQHPDSEMLLRSVDGLNGLDFYVKNVPRSEWILISDGTYINNLIQGKKWRAGLIDNDRQGVARRYFDPETGVNKKKRDCYQYQAVTPIYLKFIGVNDKKANSTILPGDLFWMPHRREMKLKGQKRDYILEQISTKYLESFH